MAEKKKKKLRIGIDARFYGPANKGIGRYAQEIVDRIINIDTENEYVIFLYQDNYDLFQNNDPRIKKIKLNIRWYTLKEQLLFPWHIWKEKLDFIHFLHFNAPVFVPIKFIVTVHDLILTKFPTVRASTLSPILYKIKNFCYKIVIWAVIKRAKLVIAVSEFTKKDIINKYKIKPDKVIVTYEGISKPKKNNGLNSEKIDDKKILLSYNIKKPYILYVGNAYPHKNLEGLLDIWPFIKKEKTDLQLVFVGKMDYFYKRIENYAKQLKNFNTKEDLGIIFTGFVKDEDLGALFKNALIYVFPSKYEGFGLPPLEAMANGCPVASSNLSCMPEILGDSVFYFNPNNSDDMKNKIIQLINNDELKEKLIKKGYLQIKKYSWQTCVKLTIEAHQKIINKN